MKLTGGFHSSIKTMVMVHRCRLCRSYFFHIFLHHSIRVFNLEKSCNKFLCVSALWKTVLKYKFSPKTKAFKSSGIWKKLSTPFFFFALFKHFWSYGHSRGNFEKLRFLTSLCICKRKNMSFKISVKKWWRFLWWFLLRQVGVKLS